LSRKGASFANRFKFIIRLKALKRDNLEGIANIKRELEALDVKSIGTLRRDAILIIIIIIVSLMRARQSFYLAIALYLRHFRVMQAQNIINYA
jgi:hypothetical protein